MLHLRLISPGDRTDAVCTLLADYPGAASDSVFGAAFLLRGMTSAMGRIEALSYWVVSDHFEELGRPPTLLHGGFGLRTVGDLRKPRWWELELIERLGQHRLEVTIAGDGAGWLVEAVAARAADETVGVLVWNGTLDQSKAGGDDALPVASPKV